MRLLLLLVFIPCFAAPSSVSWESDFDAAMSRAKSENKVVFIALNMDGEAANDRMAKDVYHDKELIELTANTVNLLASRFDHGGSCKRFDGLECDQHKAIDTRVRADVLQAPADASVVAPQHVFLAPDGSVLLSVPYEMRTRELKWCLVTAHNKVHPEQALKMPSDARAPRRLVRDGVTAALGNDTIVPLSEEEVEATIKRIRGGLKADERVDAFLRLIATDDEDAVEFVATEMGNARFQRNKDGLTRLIQAIGVVSPPSYWIALEPFLKFPQREIRIEAIVAMEQLAAEDSLKALKAAYSKEDSASTRAALMRAMGVAGVDHKSTRSSLVKAASDKKDDELASNALLVLGLHAADKNAWQAFEKALAHESPRRRQAAALGLAFGHANDRAEALLAAREAESHADTQAIMDLAIAVLDGARMSTISSAVAKVTGSEIARGRFFND